MPIIRMENDSYSQLLRRKDVDLMPLSMMQVGETKEIQDLHGKEEVKRRLQDLGFVKGEKVEVVGENSSGMILVVKEVRIALNKGVASQIMVA